MYPDVSLFVSILFILVGLAVVTWSSDLFVGSASRIARILGVSPFIIGMVIIGFGTSAPELCVSVLSGVSRHSDLSLGNAYGSAVFNVAGILGVAALIRPLVVKPSISLVGAPALVAISSLSALLVGLGGGFSRADGLLQLACFALLLPLYCWFDQKDHVPGDGGNAAAGDPPSPAHGGLWRAWILLGVGLALLVAASHVLVWGCVDLARTLGVSELMIGLTVVAIGTSLPELASAVASARRGEDEFVLGNIIGSNFFNILAVVGIAGSISPFRNISPFIMTRDLPVMIVTSLSITLFGINWRKVREKGVIARWEGLLWLLAYVAYAVVMIRQELGRCG